MDAGSRPDWPDRIEEAVQLACLWEATARKVGNVHRYRDFADTTYPDFVTSGLALARACRQAVSAPPVTVGALVLAGVTATRRRVRANTNLGITLLLAPLAAVPVGVDLRLGVGDVLACLTVADAALAYAAVRLAAPGGLGTAPAQDVAAPPTVTLLEAMKLAADRDQVARQYVTGFADVYGVGVPALLAGFGRQGSIEAAIIHCQLTLVAEFPDSLIARKCGPAVAVAVRDRAAAVMDAGGIATAAGRSLGVRLDTHLRADGNRRNPGATADLVTACLFAALRDGTLPPDAPFPWPVPDWL